MWCLAFAVLAKAFRCLLSLSSSWDHHHLANREGLNVETTSWMVPMVVSLKSWM